MAQHLDTHALLRRRLHDQAGLLHEVKGYDLAKLAETQWSEYFWSLVLRRLHATPFFFTANDRLHLAETYMRNRLLMGAFRYGSFQEQRGRGRRHDNIPSALRRLRRYRTEKKGNLERLIDAANLCLVEFVAPGSHPRPSLTDPAIIGFAVGDIGCAETSLRYYLRAGEQQDLATAAARAVAEFCFPQHPNPVWDPVDDGEHVSQARK